MVFIFSISVTFGYFLFSQVALSQIVLQAERAEKEKRSMVAESDRQKEELALARRCLNEAKAATEDAIDANSRSHGTLSEGAMTAEEMEVSMASSSASHLEGSMARQREAEHTTMMLRTRQEELERRLEEERRTNGTLKEQVVASRERESEMIEQMGLMERNLSRLESRILSEVTVSTALQQEVVDSEDALRSEIERRVVLERELLEGFVRMREMSEEKKVVVIEAEEKEKKIFEMKTEMDEMREQSKVGSSEYRKLRRRFTDLQEEVMKRKSGESSGKFVFLFYCL